MLREVVYFFMFVYLLLAVSQNSPILPQLASYSACAYNHLFEFA